MSKIERLAKAKNLLINAVGVNDETVQGRINHLANPLNVTDVRSDEPLVQLGVIARKRAKTVGDLPPPQGTEERTALEAIRYAHNLRRFNKTTIQNRRGKGKGKELRVKTDLPSPQDKYNYGLWTYSPSQYLRDGEAIQTTSLVFNDDFKNLETLRQRVSEQTNYPVQAGRKLLEETQRTHRKGIFTSTGPRKRAKTIGDVAANQGKVTAQDVP